METVVVLILGPRKDGEFCVTSDKIKLMSLLENLHN